MEYLRVPTRSNYNDEIVRWFDNLNKLYQNQQSQIRGPWKIKKLGFVGMKGPFANRNFGVAGFPGISWEEQNTVRQGIQYFFEVRPQTLPLPLPFHNPQPY